MSDMWILQSGMSGAGRDHVLKGDYSNLAVPVPQP